VIRPIQTLTLVGYTCRAPKYDSGGDVRHARSRRREAARHVLVARYPPLVRSGRRDAIPGRLLTSTGRSATSGQVYAGASVNGEIKRFFRDKRWQAGVRLADQELLRVCKLRAELIQELGGTPTDAEVAPRLKVSVEVLEATDLAALAMRCPSASSGSSC
jgi:hypothetical protein